MMVNSYNFERFRGGAGGRVVWWLIGIKTDRLRAEIWLRHDSKRLRGFCDGQTDRI